ncbi:MAG: hypothetical protein KDH20_03515 [Rhodocyclaceae bacterium]|nr:hypothetical protein [Rhodocyclaceae bacterium]
MLILTPVLCALMTGPLAHRVHRRLAKADWWFEVPLSQTSAAMRNWSGATPENDWLWRHRRLELRDRTDALRAWFSSEPTLSRSVTVCGDPVPKAPFVGITLHYGPGLWSLRMLKSLGVRASFLSIPMRREDYPGRPLLFLFESARNFVASRLGTASVTYASNAFDQLATLLTQGQSIVGMLDVPGVSPKYRRRADLLGREISLPTGLIALAAQRQVPILAFYVRERTPGGPLELVTRVLAHGASADPFDEVSRFLCGAITDDAAPWHAWSWPSPEKAFEARSPVPARSEVP